MILKPHEKIIKRGNLLVVYNTITKKYSGIREFNEQQKHKILNPNLFNNKEKINVCVVRSGNIKYKFESVIKLYEQIKNNLTIPFDFYQFTDNPQETYEGINNIDFSHIKEIPENSWWAKLLLFNKDLRPKGRILFFDLDTFVVNNINKLAEYSGDKLAICKYEKVDEKDYNQDKYGSHCMNIPDNFGYNIWENFSKNIKYHTTKFKSGDERVIQEYTNPKNVYIWQNILEKDYFVKLKKFTNPLETLEDVSKKASIIICHGNPKPHHLIYGDYRYPDLVCPLWVKQLWNVSEKPKKKAKRIMKEKIGICTFLWDKPYHKLVNGHTTLPADTKIKYTPKEVNITYNMLKRNIDFDFDFFVITDFDESRDIEFNENINIIPMWNDLREFGSCHHRLKLFDKSMKEVLGVDRIFQIDLDVVIVDNVTDIFSNKEDVKFYGLRENVKKFGGTFIPFNGSLWQTKVGKFPEVFTDFDFNRLQNVKKLKKYVGSDQARFAEFFDNNTTPTWTKKDGVYDFLSDMMMLQNNWRSCTGGRFNPNFKVPLPKDAKIICFPGARFPQEENTQIMANWIHKYYY